MLPSIRLNGIAIPEATVLKLKELHCIGGLSFRA